MYSLVINYDATQREVTFDDLKTDLTVAYMLSDKEEDPTKKEKVLTVINKTFVKDIESLVDTALLNTSASITFELKKDGNVIKTAVVENIKYIFGLDEADQLVERVTLVIQ